VLGGVALTRVQRKKKAVTPPPLVAAEPAA
jgi:hypothetical protein